MPRREILNKLIKCEFIPSLPAKISGDAGFLVSLQLFSRRSSSVLSPHHASQPAWMQVRGQVYLYSLKAQIRFTSETFLCTDWKHACCLVKDFRACLSPLQSLAFICTCNDAASQVSLTALCFISGILLLCSPRLLLSTLVYLADVLYAVRLAAVRLPPKPVCKPNFPYEQ